MEDLGARYEDGATTIFVSSDKIYDGIPPNMQAFLIYLKNSRVTTTLTEEIECALKKLIDSTERREEFMELYEKFIDFREEGKKEGHKVGLQEGRKEGHKEAQEEFVNKILFSGKMSPTELADTLGVTLPEIESMIHK